VLAGIIGWKIAHGVVVVSSDVAGLVSLDLSCTKLRSHATSLSRYICGINPGVWSGLSGRSSYN